MCKGRIQTQEIVIITPANSTMGSVGVGIGAGTSPVGIVSRKITFAASAPAIVNSDSMAIANSAAPNF